MTWEFASGKAVVGPLSHSPTLLPPLLPPLITRRKPTGNVEPLVFVSLPKAVHQSEKIISESTVSQEEFDFLQQSPISEDLTPDYYISG